MVKKKRVFDVVAVYWEGVLADITGKRRAVVTGIEREISVNTLLGHA